MRQKKGAMKLHVDTDLLKGKIVANGLTQERVAAQIGMDRSTFSRKMQNNALSFSVGDMHALCNILGLSAEEAKKIFLA